MEYRSSSAVSRLALTRRGLRGGMRRERGETTDGGGGWKGRRVLAGLLGDGIGYSLSAALHECEADKLGLRVAYNVIDTRRLRLTSDAVGEIVRFAALLGFAGLNVTYPYKQAVIEYLDDLDPLARKLNAVNAIVFDGDGKSRGHNTDEGGFGGSLDDGIPGVCMGRVVQLGAGGVGAATAHAVLARHASHLSIVDPKGSRAEQLAIEASSWFPETTVSAVPLSDLAAVVAKADGVVNASPVGSPNAPGSPLDPALHRDSLWVADVIYSPLETQLLRDARSADAPALNGGRMLVLQAAASFELFTGIKPDVRRMHCHFVELTAEN